MLSDLLLFVSCCMLLLSLFALLQDAMMLFACGNEGSDSTNAGGLFSVNNPALAKNVIGQ